MSDHARIGAGSTLEQCLVFSHAEVNVNTELRRAIVTRRESTRSSPMSRLALVTGGAGFIGSHLVDGLLDAGWRVRVLDNLTTGLREHVSKRAEFVCGDVGDDLTSLQACEQVDTVFHLARG